MKKFTVYDPSTGVITGLFQSSHPPEGRPYVEGDFDPSEYLIKGGEPIKVGRWTPKTSPNCLGNIPKGSVVTWGGGSHQVVVDDGVLEFDLVLGQRLFLKILPPGLPPCEVEIAP